MRERFSGGTHRRNRQLPRRRTAVAGSRRKNAYIFPKFAIVKLNERNSVDRAIRKLIRAAIEDGLIKNKTEDDVFEVIKSCFNGGEVGGAEDESGGALEVPLNAQRAERVPFREMSDMEKRKLFGNVVLAISECDMAFWFLVHFDRVNGNCEIKHLTSSLRRKKEDKGISMGGLMKDILKYAEAVKKCTSSTPVNRARKYWIRKVSTMSKVARAWLGLAPFQRMRWKNGELVVDERNANDVAERERRAAVVEEGVRQDRGDFARRREVEGEVRGLGRETSRQETSDENDVECEGQENSEEDGYVVPEGIGYQDSRVADRTHNHNTPMNPVSGSGAISAHARRFDEEGEELNEDDISNATDRVPFTSTPMISSWDGNVIPDDTTQMLSVWECDVPDFSAPVDIVAAFNERDQEAETPRMGRGSTDGVAANSFWEVQDDDNLDSCFDQAGAALYG